MNEIIKTLVKKGFVKGHRKILSDAEIEELKNFLVKHREEFNKHNNSKNDPGRLGKRSMMFCITNITSIFLNIIFENTQVLTSSKDLSFT